MNKQQKTDDNPVAYFKRKVSPNVHVRDAVVYLKW